jgi:UDP-3-O-[3-hydroxymyristoyl] glucosamine N-acyltransferase
MDPFAARRPMTAAALVAALPAEARIVGDSGRMIHRIAPIEDVRSGALIFSKLAVAEVPSHWAGGDGVVAVVPSGGQAGTNRVPQGVTLIEVASPRSYFIRAINLLTGGEAFDVPAVGSGVEAAPDARVGKNVRIAPGVTVGARSVIEDGCVVFSGVRICDDVHIGAGCVVQSNAVIGCQGQAYVRDENGLMVTMPHLGGVVIGERSRVGANATVVRGTLRNTTIGSDTSIGNNASVGHNVEVGSRCFIGPGVTLAGSSAVGDDTWVSIGVLVRGVKVGRNATVGAGAVVTRPVADGQTVNGFPARVTAAQG